MDLDPADAEVYFSTESDRLISLPAGNKPVATAAAAVAPVFTLQRFPLLLNRLSGGPLHVTDIILPQLA